MGARPFVTHLGPRAKSRISKFEVPFILKTKRKAFTNATCSAFFWRFVCQNPSTTAFWLKQLTARCANGSVYDSAWGGGKLTKTDGNPKTYVFVPAMWIVKPISRVQHSNWCRILGNEKYLHVGVGCMFLQVFWVSVFPLLPLLHGF